MLILDISVPVSPALVVWPGDPPVTLDRTSSMDEGAEVNITRAGFTVHAGTHVDAPLHFIRDGGSVEALELETLVGRAIVVDVPDGDVDAAAVAAAPEGDRLLFRTRNGELWEHDSFADGFARVTPDGARALVERGVRLVGVDYLSVGDEETHRILLGAGLVVVEGLDLRRAEPGAWGLVCLPLKLVGAEGAPARAILTRD